MSLLVATRGLPASGKTTYGRKWVAQDRAHRARVNRDDLRNMLDDGIFIKGVTEPRIVAARDAAILGLLERGLDVICDDTNLRQRVVQDLLRLATRARAGFEVVDLTHVPLEVCIERDSLRTDKFKVGRQVIEDLHKQFLAGRKMPLPLPQEDQCAQDPDLYQRVSGARIILVDVDGTIALKGARSAYDESRVHEDRPNMPVIELIRYLYASGNQIIYMSGRTEACREATIAWIDKYVSLPFLGIFMRSVGDKRKDAVVKKELFDAHIRNFYDVFMVLDDRDQVVKMWRRVLGLPTMQVAEGNF